MNFKPLCFLVALALCPWAAAESLVECVPRDGLPNFFATAEQGGDVCICYLGGSITEQPGWRLQSADWFQQQFPKAHIRGINAGVGGTGSDLGVFRLRHDVLEQKPDLLFVEFAVNDFKTDPDQIDRAMEGIVRQTWRANPKTDICFVYTICGPMRETYSQQQLPRSVIAMEKVAAHYGIPSINFGVKVTQLDEAGKLIFQGPKPKTTAEKAALNGKIVFSPDSTHPYPDTGHVLYLEAIERSVPAIKSQGTPGPHALIEPLMTDNWENAKVVSLDQATLSGGWKKLDPATSAVAKKFLHHAPQIWEANQPGDSVNFKFHGTDAAIYDVMGPDCGQVIVTLDQQKPVIVPRFDPYCTYYRLSLLKIGSHLPDTEHSVKIEIHPDQPDKRKILLQRNEKMDDPKRFDGRAFYPAAILIVGQWAR